MSYPYSFNHRSTIPLLIPVKREIYLIETHSIQGTVLCLVSILSDKGMVLFSPPRYPVELKKQDREPSPVLEPGRGHGDGSVVPVIPQSLFLGDRRTVPLSRL